MNISDLHHLFTPSHKAEFNRLPVEEEALYIKLAKNDDTEAFGKLLITYLPLLRSAVFSAVDQQHRVKGAEKFQDAIQEAATTLWVAIREHDLDASPRLGGYLKNRLRRTFETFAVFEVPMKVSPRNLERFRSSFRRAKETATSAREEIALARKIATEMIDNPMELETWDAIYDATRRTDSLTTGDEDGVIRAEVVAYSLWPQGYTAYEEVEDRAALDSALAKLSDEERRVIDLTFGFLGIEGREPEALSCRQVGMVIGKPTKTVNNWRAKALDSMRKSMREDLYDC